MNSSNHLRLIVFASLMAALMAAGAFFAIPIGPVPIVLQNMFVFLAGLLLGSRWGVASVGVYLFAGALGLPVFAGGIGGIGRLVGPTGGYLVGFLPAVFVIGLIAERVQNDVFWEVIAMVCGTVIIYLFGVAWLKRLTHMTLSKTLAIGMYPFLLGDIIKIAAAVPIVRALRPVVRVPGSGFRASG